MKKTKVCSLCKIEKSISSFHKHASKKDGYRSHCKECRHQTYIDNIEINIAKSRELYRKNRDKLIVKSKQWRLANPEKASLHKNQWRKRNHEKARAHWSVSNALRSGKIIREPCGVCGDIKVHAHHNDYSKPLDVIWLCDQHHKKIHGVLVNG